jgi:hypothetical protein
MWLGLRLRRALTGDRVKLTLFSVDEANKLIVELRPLVQRLVAAKTELDQLNARIDVLQVVLAGTAPTNPDAVELRGATERRAQVVGQIQQGVKIIHKRGALVKDLDKGLLDFYALLGDRLVFLCWHLGESEVTHWHSIEGGFSERQPLDRSELD